MKSLDLIRGNRSPASLARASEQWWRRMDRLFDEMTSEAFVPRFTDLDTLIPACEFSESDDQYTISVDVPGLRKQDIDIEISGNTLRISGERKQETSRKDGSYNERRYGKFERTFDLPSIGRIESAKAIYEGGVLHLTIPKSTEAKAKHIEVLTSGETADKKNSQVEAPRNLKIPEKVGN